MSGATAKRALTPLLLFALAFGARALTWPTVLSPRGVHLPEPDAWYHLRRVMYAVRNAPESLGFDPFLNFPHGATAIWPPLFDAAVAWGVRVLAFGLGGGFDEGAVERAVVWVPPLLGALTVVALYALARRHFGVCVAIVAAGVLAVLPGAVAYARVGVLDHHVAVACLAVLGLDAAMRCIAALGSGARVWPAATLLGAWSALVLHVWPGAVLHVVLVAAGLVGFLATRGSRVEALRTARVLSAVFAGSALLLACSRPALPEHLGAFTPTALSLFQPALLAAGALVSGGCALLWSLRPQRGERGRAAQLLGACVLLAGAALSLLPGLDAGIEEAWAWLARGERFQASVVESRPLLLAADGQLDLEPTLRRLSAFAFLLPALLAWLGVRAWRQGRSEHLLLVGYALAVGVAALLQTRFVNSLAAPASLLVAWGCVELARALGRTRVGSRQPRAAVAAVVLLGAALLAPALRTYGFALGNALARLRGEPVTLTREDRYWLALEEVALWLRERTPPAGDPWDAAAHPRYGVLGHWQTGHLLLYRGQRPVLVGNFGDDVQGDNYRLSFEYFRASEENAVELLDGLRVRYVVVRPLDFGARAEGGDALLERLADPDAGDASRHRLVYEREVLPGSGEHPRAHFRVFERVAGARVEGHAAPGSEVVARLPYRSPTGRKGSFVQRARVDDRGRYALRLPVSTQGGPTAVVTADAWQIERAPGHSAALVVPERAVREGERLDGPSLP